jgi:predicted RNase H-like HicB family nuclease
MSSSQSSPSPSAVRSPRRDSSNQPSASTAGTTKSPQTASFILVCSNRIVASNLTRVTMKLTLEVTQDANGRWIAEVPELPGVTGYGNSAETASTAAKALSFRVLAAQLEAGDLNGTMVENVSFGE